MENKTVWSVICDSASVLPLELGWKRKTSESRLARKAFKDIYQLNTLANCYFIQSLIELMQMVHSGAFEHFCLTCCTYVPNTQLDSTQYLLHAFELMKKPFSEHEFKCKHHHWDVYKGAQWAKRLTVGELIDKVNIQVCRKNLCHIHKTLFKKETLNAALLKMFRHYVECLVLLSVSCNYEEDSCKYYDSPRQMLARIPIEIVSSVSSAVSDIVLK